MSGGISKLLEGASRFLRSVWRWSTAVAKYVFDSSRRVDPAVVFHLTVGALFGTLALGVLGWPQAWSFILACALLLIVCSFIGFPTIRWSILSNLLKNRVFCWTLWGALALLFAVSGSTIILLIGGIPIGNLKLVDTSTGTSETRIELPRSETTSSASNERGATQGAALTASVSFFGAVGAALFFFLNREQKERQMEEQARRERDLAELARMDAHFRALAESFESNNVATKVNAAIGLAELATTPDPQWIDAVGQPRVEQLKPLRVSIQAAEDSKSIEFELRWPADFRSIKTSRNYPYFERCFRRLVAAQREWSDRNAKEEAQNLLRQLLSWAKDPKTDEPLLHDAVRVLAFANASAWQSVRRDFQNHRHPRDLTLSLLRDSPGLLYREYHSRLTLRLGNVATTEDKRAIERELLSLDDMLLTLIDSRFDPTIATAETTFENDSFWRENVTQEYFQYFITTRQLLAESLKSLSPPPETTLAFWQSNQVRALSSKLRNNESLFLQVSEELIRTRRNVSLTEVNLMFADISFANMHGFELSKADLFATSCMWTKFAYCSGTRVNFSMANLVFASLYRTNFEIPNFKSVTAVMLDASDSRMEFADFASSSFLSSSFAQCSFSDSTFLNAEFRNTSFENCTFSFGLFSGCNLSAASLQHAKCFAVSFQEQTLENCWVAGATFGDPSGEHCTFKSSDWTSANFKFHPCSDEVSPHVFENFLAFRMDRQIQGLRVPRESARIDRNLRSELERIAPKELQ